MRIRWHLIVWIAVFFYLWYSDLLINWRLDDACDPHVPFSCED